jgi:hypothetical protein
VNPFSVIDARALPELPTLKTASEEGDVGQPGDRDRGSEYDHRLVEALENPIRADFLRHLAKRRILSAPQALPLMTTEADLDKLAYQTRLLADFGLIEPVGEPDPQRGLPFRLTSHGRRALAALGVSSSEEA